MFVSLVTYQRTNHVKNQALCISKNWRFLQDAEAAAREDVMQVMDVMADYRRRWEHTWEEQERRLRQNLQICQFNYDLRQVRICH